MPTEKLIKRWGAEESPWGRHRRHPGSVNLLGEQTSHMRHLTCEHMQGTCLPFSPRVTNFKVSSSHPGIFSAFESQHLVSRAHRGVTVQLFPHGQETPRVEFHCLLVTGLQLYFTGASQSHLLPPREGSPRQASWMGLPRRHLGAEVAPLLGQGPPALEGPLYSPPNPHIGKSLGWGRQ